MTRSDNAIFEDLFVLEAASNHWGSLERGIKLVREYAKIVRFNNVRASIKFQLRDFDNLIHKDYRHRTDVRYIKKTLCAKLSDDEFAILIEEVKKNGCIPMATPFDDRSVDLCVKLNLPIIKLASSDLNDWPLIEKVAKTKKPVIASTGGSSLKDIDDLVRFFENRNIPLAINHCVSIYPSEDHELELDHIDFLKNRYPNHVIGLSTHEYNRTYSNWTASMFISYAKGVRTWERHIDIDSNGIPVAPYCSLPYQIDEWFKTYHKAREMCGASSHAMRVVPLKERRYLDETVRGVYATADLPKGHVIKDGDFYLAIPLLKGQISCQELMTGEVLRKSVKKDKPIFIDTIESPYAYNETLKNHIYSRGINPNPPQKGNGTSKNKASDNKKHSGEKQGNMPKAVKNYLWYSSN